MKEGGDERRDGGDRAGREHERLSWKGKYVFPTTALRSQGARPEATNRVSCAISRLRPGRMKKVASLNGMRGCFLKKSQAGVRGIRIAVASHGLNGTHNTHAS
eukprot:2162368-Pleurochrysis_carterae.AAC.2